MYVEIRNLLERNFRGTESGQAISKWMISVIKVEGWL